MIKGGPSVFGFTGSGLVLVECSVYLLESEHLFGCILQVTILSMNLLPSGDCDGAYRKPRVKLKEKRLVSTWVKIIIICTV